MHSNVHENSLFRKIRIIINLNALKKKLSHDFFNF